MDAPPAGPGKARDGENEDDTIVETDPDGRYYRYNDTVGRGKFKQIYKAFDTQIGIDVAWSKITAKSNRLSEGQLQAAVSDMQKGLDLEHPNVIKCFKCWEDEEQQEINLITELFTSGNLRQYRTQHKNLDIKAIKRMARQILKGLDYLHSNSPSITHGDLRCDKIYVNGHSGEIKIGDLGLATLLPYRWENPEAQKDALTTPSDIFAFGLCMLELLTLKELDPQHCGDCKSSLAEVTDEEARVFVSKCLGPTSTRPSALDLLEDSFLSVKKVTAPGDNPVDLNASSKSLHEAIEKRKTDESADVDPAAGAPITVGKLRGEDYQFEFHGKVKDGKMHFRLIMTMAAEAGVDAPFLRTIDFVFDPEVDTPDKLASEISEEFSLSPTDTEICAAALREWLAKEMPGIHEGK